MNRKERRAARTGKTGGPFGPGPASGPAPGGLGGSLFAGAVAKFTAGETNEAERLCRDVLMLEPRHSDALHLIGMIAARAGRYEAARDLIGRSLAINARNADAHFNMAQVTLALRRIDETAAHLAQTIALRPDHAAAHRQLADLSLQHGRLDAAVAHYRDAIHLKPDDAEATSNLGVALATLGRWDDAIAAYRRALALNPGLVDVYRNLGRIVLARGDATEALALARRGLAIGETQEMRAFFVQCARSAPTAGASDDFRDLVARALAEGWSRPSELAETAANLFRNGDAGRTALGAAEPPRASALTALADDRVLRALLESAPVCDVAIERLLTAVRRTLLDQAAGLAPDDATLSFFCALAQQCFINEYVFAVDGGERARVAQLRDRVSAAVSAGGPVAPLAVVALACYAPLHALACAAAMLERAWPEPVSRLLEKQVREPLAERELRASLPALTTIADDVSLKVQRQYEEMPYPRWLTAAPVGRPTPIDWYLRNQFPRAPIQTTPQRSVLDVLIAGCGTGQQPIEAARRFVGARVLAIDLSRASLGYARRKARALALDNLDFAQADILGLGSFGRDFDLIESSGVLHHMSNPLAGWRVLLGLLRPGGFMNIGLYSATARADIRAARAFIAERGHGDTADDIRRVRQEILALDDDAPLRRVARYQDFFTTSECRDLLFHVQEHQFTIPAIKVFIDEHGLTFLGFATPRLADYHRRFPDDPAACNLDQWHVFEMENPETFTGMYQFWLQKR